MSMIRRRAHAHKEEARAKKDEIGDAHIALYKQRGVSRAGPPNSATSVLNDALRADRIGVLDVGATEDDRRATRCVCV